MEPQNPMNCSALESPCSGSSTLTLIGSHTDSRSYKHCSSLPSSSGFFYELDPDFSLHTMPTIQSSFTHETKYQAQRIETGSLFR